MGLVLFTVFIFLEMVVLSTGEISMSVRWESGNT